MHSDYPFWPWHGFGVFFIFLLICIVVAFFLGKKVCGGFGMHRSFHDKESGTPQTPMDILKIRYAKGEITQEEFEKMKKTLSE